MILKLVLNFEGSLDCPTHHLLSWISSPLDMPLNVDLCSDEDNYIEVNTELSKFDILSSILKLLYSLTLHPIN